MPASVDSTFRLICSRVSPVLHVNASVPFFSCRNCTVQSHDVTERVVDHGLIRETQMAPSTYLVDVYTLHAASAMAANTVMRSIFGAFIPLAGQPMYRALGLGWGNSLLGFFAIALIPIPILFVKYGEELRRKFPVKL